MESGTIFPGKLPRKEKRGVRCYIEDLVCGVMVRIQFSMLWPSPKFSVMCKSPFLILRLGFIKWCYGEVKVFGVMKKSQYLV